MRQYAIQRSSLMVHKGPHVVWSDFVFLWHPGDAPGKGRYRPIPGSIEHSVLKAPTGWGSHRSVTITGSGGIWNGVAPQRLICDYLGDDFSPSNLELVDILSIPNDLIEDYHGAVSSTTPNNEPRDPSGSPATQSRLEAPGGLLEGLTEPIPLRAARKGEVVLAEIKLPVHGHVLHLVQLLDFGIVTEYSTGVEMCFVSILGAAERGYLRADSKVRRFKLDFPSRDELDQPAMEPVRQ